MHRKQNTGLKSPVAELETFSQQASYFRNKELNIIELIIDIFGSIFSCRYIPKFPEFKIFFHSTAEVVM